jgi:hypothetical protein
MTRGMQAIRAALIVIAVAGCGSAAAQLPASGAVTGQRGADIYLTAGDGRAEGPDSAFGLDPTNGVTVGADTTLGAVLVP